MKLKNHPFFKTYRNLKYFLLFHLAVSLLISVSTLVHGFIDGDVIGSITNPFENSKALFNPEKYLKNAVFVVDTAYIEIPLSTKPGSISTIIRGNLLHSKIKKEIICKYNKLDAFYDSGFNVDSGTFYSNRKTNIIKVWKNIINDEVFLKDKKQIKSEKVNAILGVYFQLSLIILILILVILKNKLKKKLRA